MKLTIIVLLFLCLLCTTSLGAPLFNLPKLLENFRFLIRRSSDSQQDDAVNRTTSGLQPDEDDAANLTKEELYELFWKLNLSVAIEPPPSSESGSGDAESGEDECTEDEFTCKDGGCIPTDKVCNKKFDCEDKSDEDKSYCKKKKKEERKKKCKKDQFTCDNGKCISIYYRCDGDNDCGDNSDEGRNRCLKTECPRHDNIHCPSNGVCIETMFICDGYKDCPDNWDERACPI